MREHPWHIRRPTTEHYQRFRNLVDLHQLTTSWLKDLDIEEPSAHHIKRVSSPGISESLKILESLTHQSVPSELEGYLDDAYPEELLEKLEQTIWVMQAWSLRSIIEQTERSEWDAMKNLLEQSSWKSGRQACRKRWNEVPDYATRNLRGVLAAFQDSPLSGYPNHSTFLVRRAISTELELELLACPHLSPFNEVRSVADELCALHTHFMRGYVYNLNTLILMDYQQNSSKQKNSKQRCTQRWFFHPSGPHTLAARLAH